MVSARGAQGGQWTLRYERLLRAQPVGRLLRSRQRSDRPHRCLGSGRICHGQWEQLLLGDRDRTPDLLGPHRHVGDARNRPRRRRHRSRHHRDGLRKLRHHRVLRGGDGERRQRANAGSAHRHDAARNGLGPCFGIDRRWSRSEWTGLQISAPGSRSRPSVIRGWRHQSPHRAAGDQPVDVANQNGAASAPAHRDGPRDSGCGRLGETGSALVAHRPAGDPPHLSVDAGAIVQPRAKALAAIFISAGLLAGLGPTAHSAVRAGPPPPVPGHYGRVAPGHTVDLRQLPSAAPTPTLPRKRGRELLSPTPMLSRKPGRKISAATPTLPRKRGREILGPTLSSSGGQGTTELQLQGFPGIDRAQSATLGSDQPVEPPDTQIAVGPTTVVEMVNSNISTWSKAGVRQTLADLNAFYAVPAGYSLVEPRLLYDLQSGRFFATATAADSAFNSIVYVAVSQSSDPTAWTVWTVKGTSRVATDRPTVGTSDDKL